jgi:sulfate permease, SulP family
MFSLPSQSVIKSKVSENWKAGLTVALISVPLSIALSIASGAGPLPGLIAGIWGTLIGSIFIGSQYNILGAAGALTTVLFAAVLSAPLGLGAAILPLLALFTGVIVFLVWLLKLDRYLYYIPSSVMYGFAAGVAILIAASQLFDATGPSSLAPGTSLVTSKSSSPTLIQYTSLHSPSSPPSSLSSSLGRAL